MWFNFIMNGLVSLIWLIVSFVYAYSILPRKIEPGKRVVLGIGIGGVLGIALLLSGVYTVHKVLN